MLIRLRHTETGALLGSLPQNYQHPLSSLQQIVGGSAKRDQNSVWLVKPPHDQRLQDLDGHTLINGSFLRLEHVSTHRNLHSHNSPAPLTGPAQHEVTAYNHQGPGVGDNQDDWSLQLVGQGTWQTGMSFRLRHVATNRLLHSHGLAHNQRTAGLYEVTAVDQGDMNDLYVCVEADLPASDDAPVPTEDAPEPTDAEYGWWIAWQFRRYPVQIILFSVALIGGTWLTLDKTLLAISERQLAAVQDDRSRVSENYKEATEQLTALRGENAELKGSLAQSTARVAALERQGRMRLTEVQVASLANSLGGEPKGLIGVSYNRGDALADGLSNDFRRALEKAGFTAWTGFYDEYSPESGIWLEIPETSYRPELVKKLLAAFHSVGIELKLKLNEKVKRDGTEMEIRITN